MNKRIEAFRRESRGTGRDFWHRVRVGIAVFILIVVVRYCMNAV